MIVAGLGTFALPDALATGALGEWVTQGHAARVDVRPCRGEPEKLCGVITWLWEPVDAHGKPMLDVKHPDAARRSHPLVGLEMLSGFKPGPISGSWEDGYVYNPEDGRTYSSKMKLRSPEVLEVEGCVLFLCSRQIWRRVPRRCDTESQSS